MKMYRWKLNVLLCCILSLHCGPKESALVVQVKNWPEGVTRLRVLPTFTGQAKPAFFVEPGVSEFTVFVPNAQAGRAIVEAMVEDSDGCYVAGQLARAEFTDQPSIQRIELALNPYETKQCAVQSFSRLEKIWMDRTDNGWTVGENGTILRWNGKAWFSTIAGRSEFISAPG